LALGAVFPGPPAFGQPPRGSVVSPAFAPTSGSLLIASRWLADPNFGESVILLIEAGKTGAMGVILNRRTSISVAEALPQIEELGDSDDLLYAGGPVAPTKPVILVLTSSPPEDSVELVENEVYLLRSAAAVRAVIEDPTDDTVVRVFAGYAGWAPGQLEAEIDRSDWHILPGSAKWIFSDDPQTVWSRLLALVFQSTA